MANLELSTVFVGIQAVKKQIEYYEGLMDSETVLDKPEIEELLLSLDLALENLKDIYNSMRIEGSNYPEYEALINGDL